MTPDGSAPVGGFRLGNVWKRFGSLQVLSDVTVAAGAGQVHSLVGENGAGKTTLVRILAGLEQADEGTVEVGSVQLPLGHSPREALDAGVGLVPQHCEVVAGLTVLENLALGREPSHLGVLRRDEVASRADQITSRLGFTLDWSAPAESLGLGQRQRLELVKALWRGSGVLVFDEPTTVLTAAEVSGLFDVLRSLAAEGRTILLITHKLEEVRQISDDVTVLRGGVVAGRVSRDQIDLRELARMMVGDVGAPPMRQQQASPGPLCLRVAGLRTTATGQGDRSLRGIDIDLHAGEIVGIAGVEGNGQSELCEAILGLRKAFAGVVELDGTSIGSLSVLARRERGLANIPADRMHDGIDSDATLWENVTAAEMAAGHGTRMGLLDRRGLRARARSALAEVGVRGQIELPARALSGGNIQRLIVGRELGGEPRVLIASHPTRGVDVRGIAFIHEQLLSLRARGCAILVVSADLDELAQLADRVEVLYDGRIVGGYVPGEADAGDIGLLMSGVPAERGNAA